VTSSAPRHHRYTYADYAGLERYSDTKHEFLEGEIYALAGGSAEHAALAVEVLGILREATAAGPCRAYSSDLRVYVEATGLATFPDGSVICGPLVQHPPSPDATAVNPTVLVEVTSDSSEAYDHGAKLEHYRTIPTLRDYVIVSHRERRISVHSRTATGEWLTRTAVAGGSVALQGLPCRLSIDELYRKSAVS
jgi:Uma2 family endonuclease